MFCFVWPGSLIGMRRLWRLNPTWNHVPFWGYKLLRMFPACNDGFLSFPILLQIYILRTWTGELIRFQAAPGKLIMIGIEEVLMKLFSLKLTSRHWKLMVGRWSFLLGLPIFRGYLSFRECTCLESKLFLFHPPEINSNLISISIDFLAHATNKKNAQ